MWEMLTISDGEVVEVDIYDEEEASINGQYMNAVRRTLGPDGDPFLLGEFEDLVVGGEVLETRFDVIEKLAARGELNFREIYLS